MRNLIPTRRTNNILGKVAAAVGTSHPRNLIIGAVLLIALFAFEMFNFDTTRYALDSLLGGVTFANIGWATILAVAFCAIDFAGLARLFTPEKGADEPKEVWYLMGAWLLGATMNAVMTWWAVSLTLLNHQLGNEILAREQLLRIVPIFVAVLVWLTRILFIGSLTVAGEHFFDFHGEADSSGRSNVRSARPNRPVSKPNHSSNRTNSRRPATAARFSAPVEELTYVDEPEAMMAAPQTSKPAAPPTPVRQPQSSNVPQRTSRIQRRTPVAGVRPGMPVGMQAKSNTYDTRKMS